jgi:SWIM zinc finger
MLQQKPSGKKTQPVEITEISAFTFRASSRRKAYTLKFCPGQGYGCQCQGFKDKGLCKHKIALLGYLNVSLPATPVA